MLNITPKNLRIQRGKGTSEKPEANLLLEYEGTRDWGVIPAEFLIDGTTVVNAPLGEGLPLWVEIETGAHTLELRYASQNKAYTLNLPEAGDYQVKIRYGRFSGFSVELRTPVGEFNLSPAISGVSTGGRFFNCKTLNTGPAGLAETFTFAGAAAPTLRPAKVRIQDDALIVSFQDSTGISHDALSVPVADVTSVETHRMTKGKQMKMLLMRSLAMVIFFGIVLVIGIIAKIGVNEITRTSGGFWVIIGISLVGGVILSFFFVFLRGLFKVRSEIQQLIFHAGENRSFGVIVNKSEMIEATEMLDWAGIRLSKSEVSE